MLHISDFNSNYISPLLHKLSKESSKQIFLLSDFNIDLLKHESSELVNSFLDTLSSNFLSPPIILPTRISSLATLIDNAPQSKCNIYTHDWKRFDEEKLIFEFNSQDWDNILVLDKENVNETIDSYLQNLKNLLEKKCTFKKVE